MDAMKLLIADGNEEFRRALAAELQGAYHVRCCGDGKEALSLLRSFVPDVLVLDLMLPELDGISLLQSAASAGLCPMVLVTSRFYNDYILGALGELSVGYMMRKPCDIPATAARIGDLSRHIRAPLVTPPDPQTQVTNLLLSLNIPSKLRGYAYLREAIPRMMKDPDRPLQRCCIRRWARSSAARAPTWSAPSEAPSIPHGSSGTTVSGSGISASAPTASFPARPTPPSFPVWQTLCG